MGERRGRRPQVKDAVTAVGRHILADLYGISGDLLSDGTALDMLMRTAALSAGCEILHSHFHSFGAGAGAGAGVTGVVLLAESHLSIHTWPEFEFAAADIFMCGSAEPDRALAVLVAALSPRQQTIKTESRGRAYRP